MINHVDNHNKSSRINQREENDTLYHCITKLISRILTSLSEFLASIERSPLETGLKQWAGKDHKRLEAQSLILKCWKNKEDSLDLSKLELDSLPKEIGLLTHLKKLNLSHNFLKTLPSSLECLVHLEKLALNNNLLRNLPDMFEKLIRLETLLLNANLLTQLPLSLCRINSLNDLNLNQNQITALPDEIDSLSQLRRLKIAYNRLSALPNSLFQLNPACHIALDSNNFSSGAAERILETTRNENYQGPSIVLSIREKGEKKERGLSQLIEELCRHAGKEKLKLHHLQNDQCLKNWLSRLVDVGDYKNEARAKIACMIYEAIQKAENDPKFREIFWNCIQGAESTCGDRMALSILYLGLQVQINQAIENQDLKQLAHLLWRGTYLLSQLEIYAQIKESSLKGVDPVEVYLAYPIKLKNLLNIPIINESMLYFSCSGVNEGEIKKIGVDMKQLLSNSELQFAFLASEKTWEEALKVHPETSLDYQDIQNWRLDECEKKECDYEKIDQEYKKRLIELTKRFLAN